MVGAVGVLKQAYRKRIADSLPYDAAGAVGGSVVDHHDLPIVRLRPQVGEHVIERLR
jgi:hypothetical protein